MPCGSDDESLGCRESDRWLPPLSARTDYLLPVRSLRSSIKYDWVGKTQCSGGVSGADDAFAKPLQGPCELETYSLPDEFSLHDGDEV